HDLGFDVLVESPLHLGRRGVYNLRSKEVVFHKLVGVVRLVTNRLVDREIELTSIRATSRQRYAFLHLIDRELADGTNIELSAVRELGQPVDDSLRLQIVF